MEIPLCEKTTVILKRDPGTHFCMQNPCPVGQDAISVLASALRRCLHRLQLVASTGASQARSGCDLVYWVPMTNKQGDMPWSGHAGFVATIDPYTLQLKFVIVIIYCNASYHRLSSLGSCFRHPPHRYWYKHECPSRLGCKHINHISRC